jgi:hypothetical protein
MAKNETYSLEDWKQKTISEMERFIKHWKEMSEVDKESFPDELTLGEWDEQFQFCSSEALKNPDEKF